MTNFEILSLAIWYLLIFDIRYIYLMRKYWYGHLPPEEFREIAVKSAKPFDCYPCAVFWSAVALATFSGLPLFEIVVFSFKNYLIASLIEKMTRL